MGAEWTSASNERGISRRAFLAGTGVGLAGILAARVPPAVAQKREITMLGWSHFVPRSDERLREIAAKYTKETGVTVRVDTIAHLQLASKLAAEIQTQAGHDIVMLFNEEGWLHRDHLVDLDDLVGELSKKYGEIYPFVKEAFLVKGHWKVIESIWPAFPGNYNMRHFKEAGQPVPDTWNDILQSGKKLKKAGHPVGIAISHCFDANTTAWSVLWSFGAKVLEADGKTIAITSPRMKEVLEFWKELYFEAMEPEVLSWDDSSNNRCILAGKCSWIHNPVSPYAVAVDKRLPIADDINHHSTPAGPAGRFFAPTVRGYGIWKFSKNIEAAKDFLRYFYREDIYSASIEAGMGFNHSGWRYWENHPVWAKDPKLRMLPAEGQFAHMRGWPAPPSEVNAQIDHLYLLPDMAAKVVSGVPIKDAQAWASDQIKRLLEGAKG